MIIVANKILALLTLASHVVLVGGVVGYVLFRKETEDIIAKIGKHGLGLAFCVALTGTLLSLFYSDVAGYEPCVLCWYERIALYPLVLILGIAWWKKDERVTRYATPLTLIGAVVALYHNYIAYGGAALTPCAAFEGSVSCVKQYVNEFGYITIPLMSLTAFIIILVLLGLQKSYNNK